MSELARIHNVFALQRSGHHAVMNWLQSCYAADNMSTAHANDVYHGHVPELEVADPTAPEILQAASGNEVLFVNYEDLQYAQRKRSLAYCALKAATEGDDIIVVRDFYNTAASRLQSIVRARTSTAGLQLHPIDWPTVTQTWKEHANVALDRSDQAVCISYNRWFLDEQYRSNIAKGFKLSNVSDSLDAVPEFGRGSSFDGQSYSGRGRGMNVLARWQDLPRTALPEFRAIIDDPEVEALNKQLFGFGRAAVADVLVPSYAGI